MSPLLCGKFFILSQLESYCQTQENHKTYKQNTKHRLAFVWIQLSNYSELCSWSLTHFHPTSSKDDSKTIPQILHFPALYLAIEKMLHANLPWSPHLINVIHPVTFAVLNRISTLSKGREPEFRLYISHSLPWLTN